MSAPATTPETPAWRRQLREAMRDPDEMVDALGLPDEFREAAHRAAARFGLLVPHAFLARMRVGDPEDPLLRQVLPADAETGPVAPHWVADPVSDIEARRAPGLLQKYSGRVLLMAARSCAVACRYCFRRHYPYADDPASIDALSEALSTIEADVSIEEVILSGGDPLIRSDEWLGELVGRLAAIDHVARVRIHTRLPIVIPDRVTDALLETLRATRLAPTVVVHANHPAEIDTHCRDALARLVRGGVPTLNQSVLLAGINDDADVLVELSRRLLDAGVIPYYLHQLDPVAGAAHFDVDPARGHELVAEMRSRLPGLGVPRYVREEPGAPSKLDVD